MAAAQHRWGYTGNCGELLYIDFPYASFDSVFLKKIKTAAVECIGDSFSAVVPHSAQFRTFFNPEKVILPTEKNKN